MAKLEVEEVNGLSDEILAQQAKSDPEIFGMLYERHVSRIYSYTHAHTRLVEDAEDLTSRIFFRSLSRLYQYTPGSDKPFTAWLYTIAHSVVVNWHREQSRHRHLSLSSVSERIDKSRESRPAQIAIKHEESTFVRKAIADLPAHNQELLVLKFVNELSNAEIARRLGKSEGAVKALLHRTVVRLRGTLAPHISFE